MRNLRPLLATLLVAATATLASGFSAPGHHFVGALAEDILRVQSQSSDPAVAARAQAALARAKALLHGMSFAQASTIPDDIKAWDPEGHFETDPQGLVRERRWPREVAAELRAYFLANSDPKSLHFHHNYHFTDVPVTPEQKDAYAPGAVGTEPNDIVETLHYCENVLRGTKQPDDGRKITPEIALILMIHLAGDLHQPLHVGSEYFRSDGTPVIPTRAELASGEVLSDHGANSLEVPESIAAPYHGKPSNLHYTWDMVVPRRAFEAWRSSLGAGSDQPEELARLLARKPAPEGYAPAAFDRANLLPVFEQWANEILPLSQEVHSHFRVPVKAADESHPGVYQGALELKNPAEDYDRVEAPAIQRELLLAGWRLAWLLEEVTPAGAR